MSTKDDNGRGHNAPPDGKATDGDRARFERAHVEILRRLFESGGDDQIVTYLRGSHLGAVASAVANILRGLGDLVDAQTVLTILRTDRPEWFEPDARDTLIRQAVGVAVARPPLSVQERLEALSEAEARATLREIREEHPEWFA